MGNKKRSKNKHDKSDKSNSPSENPQNVEDTEKEDQDLGIEDYEATGKLHETENNSDNDEPPKKKKKKKQPQATDTTEKKGKKSIRQMKKERHALRQAEASAVAKDQLKSQCISYLSQWKHNRDNWKFMKAKQVWLYKNKFSASLVPDASWPTLLEYFESAKGNIRNMLLEDAKKVISQMDEWTEKQKDNNEESAEDETPNKPDDISYKRARDLIQCLEE